MGKVSVICPTGGRHEMLARCINNFIRQDWPDKEFLSVDNEVYHEMEDKMSKYPIMGSGDKIKHYHVHENLSIGAKRNILCREATGDIILHMDDDDLYAPDWISRSVDALIESNAAIVGLSNAYFHKGENIYEYSNDKNSQLYLCGATLCYWRKTWERKPFPEQTKYAKGAGEDTDFISNNGRLFAHGYKDGFLATIHGNNTCSHLAIPNMKKLPQNEAASIINRFY